MKIIPIQVDTPSDALGRRVGALGERRRTGDVSEHRAIAWLLSAGNEVFKNVCPTGPVDITSLDQFGKLTLIDVKTIPTSIRKRKDGTYTISMSHVKPTREQEGLGVKILYVLGDYIGWDLPDQDEWELVAVETAPVYGHAQCWG